MSVQQVLGKFNRKTELYLKRNGPTILTLVGVIGVITTTVSAVKSTTKALDILEKVKEEKGGDLTKLEIIKYAGPVYIPTIIFGTSTIACIFSANIRNKRKQAELISAYAVLENSYKEYKRKVIELYGEDSTNKIYKGIVSENIDEYDSEDPNEQLFFDMYSMRYFTTTKEKVSNAKYSINEHLNEYGFVPINFLYDLLGLPGIDYGDFIGWNDRNTSFIFFEDEKVIVTDDGLECIVIDFVEPSAYV